MHRFHGIILTLLSVAAFGAAAESAPPTGTITNAFACKLKDGKNYDDLWAALEGLAKFEVAWRAGRDPAGSVFLWRPFRTSSDYDYIWGYNSTDLKRMGQDLEDYISSPGSGAVEAKLAETGDCVSMIAQSREVRAGTLGNAADREVDAVVETFACGYKDGQGPADLDKAVAYWQTEFERIASPGLKAYSAWLWTPYRGNTLETQAIWVGAYPDIASWAEGDTSYNASKEGPEMDARINAVVDCRSNLWFGYWIIAPTTPAQ